MSNQTLPHKKRLEWLDAMRGFTMILVVAHHVIGISFGMLTKHTSAQEVLTLFRMPLFFLVSGFLSYKATMIWTGKSLGTSLLKKIRVQIIPTAVFLLVFTMYRYKDWWPHLLDALQASRKAGYWFTWVLLMMFVVYYLYAFVEQKIQNKLKGRLPSWIMISVFLLLALALYESAYLPKTFTYPKEKWAIASSFDCFAMYFVYFLSGNIIRRYWDKFEKLFDSRWFFPVMTIVSLVCLFEILKWHNLQFEWRNLPLTISVYSLIAMIIMYFRRNEHTFSKETRLGRVMQYIGTRTLDVYLIHYFFLPTLPMLGPFFKQYRPNIVLEIVVAIGLALLIIAFSCLTSSVLRTSPFLKKWLFGKE